MPILGLTSQPSGVLSTVPSQVGFVIGVYHSNRKKKKLILESWKVWLASLYCVLLRTAPRTSLPVLGKRFTTELHQQTLSFIFGDVVSLILFRLTLNSQVRP